MLLVILRHGVCGVGPRISEEYTTINSEHYEKRTIRDEVYIRCAFSHGIGGSDTLEGSTSMPAMRPFAGGGLGDFVTQNLTNFGAWCVQTGKWATQADR